MKINDLKQLSAKAAKTWEVHADLCDKVKEALLPFLDEEFREDISVFMQAGDGLVLEFDSSNAPVSAIIKLIKEKGRVSVEDYMNVGI